MLPPNPILDRVMQSFPFDFPAAEGFLTQDNALHTRLFYACSSPSSAGTKEAAASTNLAHHLTSIVELMSAAIRIHNQTLEANPKANANANEPFQESNKKLILTGDYFCASALRLISELKEAPTRAFIHNGISKACMGHILSYIGPEPLRPKSLRSYKKTTQLQQGGLFQLSFHLPLVLPQSTQPATKNSLRRRRSCALAYAWLYGLAEDRKTLAASPLGDPLGDRWTLKQVLGRTTAPSPAKSMSVRLDRLLDRAKSDFLRKASRAGLANASTFLSLLPRPRPHQKPSEKPAE